MLSRNIKVRLFMFGGVIYVELMHKSRHGEINVFVLTLKNFIYTWQIVPDNNKFV